MPVSGAVITCHPPLAPTLAKTLARPDAVEIHGVLPDGRLIAVIMADSVDGEVEIVSALLQNEGVIDVRLAYHNFADLGQE